MTIEPPKRLSVRAVALKYGLPTRVVARAISCGQLLAVATQTETGRERLYVLLDDADTWFSSLLTTNDSFFIGGSS
jgi:hypothetical protein